MEIRKRIRNQYLNQYLNSYIDDSIQRFIINSQNLAIEFNFGQAFKFHSIISISLDLVDSFHMIKVDKSLKTLFVEHHRN